MLGIVHAKDDLAHAAECVEQIVQRDLHSATNREDERLLRCLNTAVIVSCVRPFSRNSGSSDICKALPTEYLRVLSPRERQLHDQQITLRNRDHAHSDPESRSV